MEPRLKASAWVPLLNSKDTIQIRISFRELGLSSIIIII